MLARLMYRLGLFKLFENFIIENYSLYENLYYALEIKKCLTYVPLTKFWKLNATCNISLETPELRLWMTLKEMRQTRICGEQDFVNVKEKGMTICYIVNRCLVMSLTGGKKFVVEYWWNIVAKLKVNKW